MYPHPTSTSSSHEVRLSVAPTPPLPQRPLSSPPSSPHPHSSETSAHTIAMPSTPNRRSHHGIHSRNTSLTSACLPSGATATSSGTSEHSKGKWRVFGGWAGEETHREGLTVDSQMTSTSSTASRSRSPSPRPPAAVMLLSVLMGPFGNSLLSHYQSSSSSSPHGDSKSPNLHGLGIGGIASGSSSPIHGPGSHAHSLPSSKSRARSPLFIRLIGAAYVVFALAFFSARMINITVPSSSDDALLLRRSVEEVGNNATAVSEQTVDKKAYYDIGRQMEKGKKWTENWRNGLREGTERWSNSIDAVRRLKGVMGAKVDETNVVEVHDGPPPDPDELVPALGLNSDVRRTWAHSVDAMDPQVNALGELSHQFRFSKMYSKVQWNAHDEIEPYFVSGDRLEGTGSVTACMYSNEAWISQLPDFVSRWQGPVSLVFETTHTRQSEFHRTSLKTAINKLRARNPLIRDLVDFHIVSLPTTSQLTVNRTRERLITRPQGHNFHLNVARTFARTEAVWMVGDPRIFPSPGLRQSLQSEEVLRRILTGGDAVVVPTFGFLRTVKTEEAYTDADGDPLVGSRSAVPTLADLRATLGLPIKGPGVAQKEFARLASEFVSAYYQTLPVPMDQWPTTKKQLVEMVALSNDYDVGTPGAPVMAGHDSSWDISKGPTNFALWTLAAGDPKLDEAAVRGGGIGLGLQGANGGGDDMYRVAEYDMHYAPNIVMAKHGQPWCTERFEENKAACVYQVYLGGAELWVLPDQWAFTIDVVEKGAHVRLHPARKLEKSIMNKMYTKFHQEACMQSGRQFLSMEMWDHPKARHLRFMCDRILNSYGMGAGGES